jgi:hypothetical protein
MNSTLVTDPIKFLSQQQTLFAQGAVQFLVEFTDNMDVLRYIEVVLDMINNNVFDLQKGLSNDFPSVNNTLSLVVQAPDMIETALYTILTQQLKTSRWITALQFFDVFCQTPIDSIMSVPPGSQFDIISYIQRLCSLDLNKFWQEIQGYGGYERIVKIMEGNDTNIVNTTALLRKADTVFRSLENSMNNPLSILGMYQRVFNASVWEEVGQKVEMWTKSSSIDGLGNSLSEIIVSGVDQALPFSPELQPYLDQVIAFATVILDEVVMVLQASSLEEATKDIPSLSKLLALANSLPELTETIVFTAVFHPQKLSNTSSFMSMEALCATDPDDLLTLPPGVTLDLDAWWTKLCEINFTQVVTELTNYKTGKEIEKILEGTSSMKTNITSLTTKIDSVLLKLFEQGISINSRLLNLTVWELMTDRVERWVVNFSAADAFMLSPTPIFASMNAVLETSPQLKEALKPLGMFAAVFDEILDIALQLENRTVVGTSDVFEGWSNMQKLLDLVLMPGFMDVLLVSQEQFTSLFTNLSSIADFCTPGTPAARYLASSPDNIVDLTKIQTAFCGINFTDFLTNFDLFFDTNSIESIASGKENFNWEDFNNKLIRLTAMVDRWTKSPPVFVLPADWQNVTYWLELLDLLTPGDMSGDLTVALSLSLKPFCLSLYVSSVLTLYTDTLSRFLSKFSENPSLWNRFLVHSFFFSTCSLLKHPPSLSLSPVRRPG